MKIGGPARIRVRGRGAIELGLEPRRHRVVRLVVRAAASLGRHRARSQLDHDFFPRLRRSGDVVGIRWIENEVPRFQFRVVARDAICGDKLARGRNSWTGSWYW